MLILNLIPSWPVSVFHVMCQECNTVGTDPIFPKENHMEIQKIKNTQNNPENEQNRRGGVDYIKYYQSVIMKTVW
jgi:hypothetical protein